MAAIGIPAYRELPDDIVAELTERMFRSRIGVRWLILSTVPITLYSISLEHGLHATVLAVLVWIACAIRVAVAEAYVRRGSLTQSRSKQLRWQAAYATGGISLSVAFAALTADTIVDGDPWLAGWALATSIALAYGAIPYVALRPGIGSVQVAIPALVSASTLIASGTAIHAWMGLSMLIALISVVQHVRLQYAATVQALLDRRRVDLLASTDVLTGLSNRRHLEDVVRQSIAEAFPNLHWLGIDLDRFKTVNDTLGHAAGDTVLRTVAERIQRVAGSDAFVSRVGGDEFVVLLIGDRAHARRVAEQIALSVVEPITVPRGIARIGASVGTTAICATDTIDEIARRADERMYARKARSKLAA
ncbi:GGDEF domain-containing protein [Aureimonas jatrophae]|uniref:Diguanylate cyclase (GGDEF) domain-containing protein n=1 Tax=Aureimonas jatrophae TaxID=1166073 RepID=A0A1H0DDF4_9HYPH|nr:GGDEF domain-containing protein [Aureimonas jatrophae]MBB3951838.1 diguanylate cyclase (GGDEF)-like protein [Aureimonas jatrophae]SDN68307.1 diguanylate cyclase (GGDEF) domain-containing protein [Aureimonas jatrophae]